MRKFLLLLLMVGLVLLCSAREVDVWKTGTATINYQSNWTVSVDDPGATKQLVLTANLLANNSDQRIISLTANRPYSLVEKDGELKIIMNLSKVNGTELLSINATVLVSYDNRGITTAPAFPYPPGLDMPADTNLTAPTPEIIAKAAEVTAGSGNGLEAIARLEEFVHNHVAYNLAYADTMLSAADVFTVGEGTCDEYSHLFISMAKSVGIPARFVSGYVHSGDSWEPHAWTEAYVPGYGWLPVDPTYNEMLNLDATHLRVGSGKDQSEIAERVMASGVREVNIEIRKNYSLDLVSSANFAPISKITMEAASAGQDENLSFNVENLRDSAAFLPMRLTVQEDMGVQGRNETMLYIGPRSTVQKDYVLTLPQLEQNMVYTFPVQVQTLGGNFEDAFKRSTISGGNGQEPPAKNPPPPEQPKPPQCALGFSLIGIAMLFAFARR